MKHSGNCTYIVSAARPDATAEQNTKAHAALKQLTAETFGAIEALGRYQSTYEANVLFQAPHGMEQRIRALAADFQQECFLKIYDDQWTEFVAPDGRRLGAGWLREVSRERALQQVGHTELNGRYFTVVPK